MTIYDMWAKVKDALAKEGTPCRCHLCEGLSKAINTIDDYVDWLFPCQGSAKDNNVSTNQPDPITGLVPCGCGGRAMQEDFFDGFFYFGAISCMGCEIEIKIPSLTPEESSDRVKVVWNRAMGWKRGAK